MTNYTFEFTDTSTTYSSLNAGDTITFGAGFNFETFSFLKDGDDLVIYTDNGATLRLTNQLSGPALVHNLNFSSGETMPLDSNIVVGQSHNEILTGNLIVDNHIYGGIGANSIVGVSGNDTIYAGYGNDTIDGGLGDDVIYGGDGMDMFISSEGNDTFHGGEGQDYVSYGGHATGINASLLTGVVTDGTDTDTLINIEQVSATNYNDILIGNSDDNTLLGKDGNDQIQGRGGDDVIDGGNGNDNIRGHSGNDTLQGGGGNDHIYGGSGDDVLYGGSGTDALYGQNGADTFKFDSASYSGMDNVKDFSLAEGDKLDVDFLLSGYDPLTDAISDFIQITDNGTHSYLHADQDGGGDNFQFVAQLSGVTGLTDEAALEAAGTLIA